MSDPNDIPRTTPGRQDRAVIIAGTLVALVGLMTLMVIAIVFAVPESQNPAGTIVVVLGFFSLISTILVNNLVTGNTSSKVDKVLNGVMQAKIEDGLRSVLEERSATNPRQRATDAEDAS